MPSSDVGGAAKLESYNIYSGSTLIGNVPDDELQFTYSSVVAGTSYRISISSVSLIGEGAQSNPLTIWAINLPSAPTLTLTDTSRDSCSVQWSIVSPSANSLITGYLVYIDDGLDGDFVIGYNGQDNPSQISTTIEGLTSRSIYRLKVAATNKAGIGAESDEITCYTVAVPGQPGRP